MLGERVRVAIDGGRTGEDHTAHTRIAGGDENVQGAIDVDLISKADGVSKLLERSMLGSRPLPISRIRKCSGCCKLDFTERRAGA